MKRLFDIVFSAAVLAVTFPVLCISAILVKLDSRGRVLYRATRIGRHGRPFLLTKLRTMVEDADTRSNVVSTPNDDPRITRIGFLLRHLNIDEIPQFLDVLRGEMSVVGPRPEVPQYVRLFSEEERSTILSVRPGITDWASLWVGDKGQRLLGELEPEEAYVRHIRPEKIRLQMHYVRTRSFVVDLQIIALTIKSHIFDRLLTLHSQPMRK